MPGQRKRFHIRYSFETSSYVFPELPKIERKNRKTVYSEYFFWSIMKTSEALHVLWGAMEFYIWKCLREQVRPSYKTK